MIRKLALSAFFLPFLLTCVGHAELADWTILTIMQADNNLAPFALQNINDIQKNITGNKVNKLIYWHKPRSQQRFKYKIKATGLVEEEVSDVKNIPNMEQEVIDAMRWAVSKNPAKHYMLNLWNHGTGTIDQQNWRFRSGIPLELSLEYSWLEVPGLMNNYDRGILYSDSTKTYLNNQQMQSALKYIKENILKRNIDIIGMDACLMSMIEIAYQIKDSADYLVSSQNLEPGRGWDYGSFIGAISSSQTTYTPLKVAQTIVDTYANYYKSRYQFYTLSAIDLSCINDLQKNTETIINQIFRCHTANITGIFSAIKAAATSAIKFEGYDFIDLYSFYNNAARNIKNRNDKDKKAFINRVSPDQEKLLSSLAESLQTGMATILKSVKANRVGTSYTEAKGISIYFPHSNFHPSYSKTLFATETSWIYLVQAANLQRTQ